MENQSFSFKNFLAAHLKTILLSLFGLLVLFGVLVTLNYFDKINLIFIAPQLPKNVTSTTKTDFNSFINNILVSSFIPKSYSVSRQFTANQNLFPDTKYYTADWILNQIHFSSLIEYDKTNQIADRQILIYLPQTMSSINPSAAIQITKTYLKYNNLLPFFCKKYDKNAINIICEAFWATDTANIGITIISPELGLRDTKITYCERRKNNPAYSWKSCDYMFKDTGVQ